MKFTSWVSYHTPLGRCSWGDWNGEDFVAVGCQEQTHWEAELRINGHPFFWDFCNQHAKELKDKESK
jgi:hypothetical protein